MAATQVDCQKARTSASHNATAGLPPRTPTTMRLEVVVLMTDDVKRKAGSYNCLFPGFHGTADEMATLWDGHVQELRRLGAYETPARVAIDLATIAVSTDHIPPPWV